MFFSRRVPNQTNSGKYLKIARNLQKLFPFVSKTSIQLVPIKCYAQDSNGVMEDKNVQFCIRKKWFVKIKK